MVQRLYACVHTCAHATLALPRTALIPLPCSSLNGNLTVIVSVQVGDMDQLPALGESLVQLTFEVNTKD